MAGRNDAVIAAALEAVAQAVAQQPNVGAGNEGVRMLETFLRNHAPTFKEGMIRMELRSGSRRWRESSGSCRAVKHRRDRKSVV